MIQISVILPTYNRPAGLRRCLEGFAAQTAPRDAFEVVVIDDGSAEPAGPAAMQFADSVNVRSHRIDNSGPSAARNIAIEHASAPLLLLYEDDLLPRPAIIEHCLKFHESWPDEAHAALLWFRLDPCLRDQPLHRWAFPRLYPFPADPGIYDWRKFWSGTLTCKKNIFRFGRFSHEFRALEDAELALRLTRRIDLRIHFERRLMGLHTRPLTLADVLARTYTAGYYDYRLASKYPGAYGSDTPFEPEKLLLSEAELGSAIATARTLLSTCPQPDSPGFRALSGLCARADLHARAEGWRTAREGRCPEPPGTASRFLK